MSEWVKVKIPKTLYNRLRNLAATVGFNDPNTLAIHLLQEALVKIEEELEYNYISEEERKEIVERLKRLGYL